MTVHEGNSDLGKNRWPGINQRLFQDTEMDSMWQIRLTTHIQEGTANSVPDGEGEVAQSCPTLCDPVDCSLPGFSIHEILQARRLEWIAISFSRGSSRPRDRTQVSRIGGRCFNLWATREAQMRRMEMPRAPIRKACENHDSGFKNTPILCVDIHLTTDIFRIQASLIAQLVKNLPAMQ